MAQRRASPGWWLLSLTGKPLEDPQDPVAVEEALLALTAKQWESVSAGELKRDAEGHLVTGNEWFDQMEASFDEQTK